MRTHWGLIDWLTFQETSHAKAIDMGLSRMRIMVARLGLDHPKSFTISVAGTNGKGSSTAMLSSIYTAAGYRVGWYSSPHLLHYNERIRINGEPVSDALLIDAFQSIDVAAQDSDLTLSYFEWGTLAALWLFKQQHCDIQVLEVGLGGRLDATNVIDANAALITPIDIDHQALLGNSRECIAVEKAGIFRKGQVAVCSDENPPSSLIAAAQKLDVDLYVPHTNFMWRIQGDQWLWQHGHHSWLLPKPALNGHFQYANAAGVLMMLYGLQHRLPVTFDAVQRGLTAVKLLGRMEYRQLENKTWLFDVAHNAQSVAALAVHLATFPEPVIAVFSALSDKDVAAMVASLSPYIDSWFVAPLGVERGASTAQLAAALFQVSEARVHWYDTIAQACSATQHQPLTLTRLVFGSFVTVEQGLRWLESQP
jgi:dihydrofolate synthase/folylpolyglutamate synthase